ncbi:MAG: 5'/3'-nucleotidase SurE [Lachnospiraceae bacterium]|nr:5'/3'-nucleotidase SurE [Lachnospiraceae bacterium]
MRILITNDDGIGAPGLSRLARAATRFGEVTVIAPREQSSAMSHHVTFDRSMMLQKTDYPVSGVRAFTLDGTPADCVRASYLGMLDELPEAVLSGINDGANVGYDILYSATIGAGMEGLLYHVPVICFSQLSGGTDETADHYLPLMIEELFCRDAGPGNLWNVNFPCCSLSECRGVLYDRTLEKEALYDDVYTRVLLPEGGWRVDLATDLRSGAAPGTDMEAIFRNYVSVGKIHNPAL